MKALRWIVALLLFAGALVVASRIDHDWDLASDPNHHRVIVETVAAMVLAAPLLSMLRAFRGRGSDRKS